MALKNIVSKVSTTIRALIANVLEFFKNLACLRLIPNQLADFNKWRSKAAPSDYVRISRNDADREKITSSNFNGWATERASKPVIDINISSENDRDNSDGEFFLSLVKENNAELRYFTIHNAKIEIILDGKSFYHLQIQRCKNLELKNCYIKELTIGLVDGSISLQNCWIEKLILDGQAKPYTKIADGGILSIRYRKADISGDFILSNVYMPRYYIDNLTSIQDIRYLQKALIGSNNTLAASVLHSVELSLERKYDDIPNKIFGYIYEISSDYGNSTARPLFWLLFFFLLSTVYSFTTDCLLQGKDDLKGWESELFSASCVGPIQKSLVYALQSILNPLGIFSAKNLLVVNSHSSLLILSIIGLLGTTALALFIISLRRRFKMSSG